MFLRELSQKASAIKGAGPALCAKLSKGGIYSVADVLLYYPRQGKYEDHITQKPLAQVPQKKEARNFFFTKNLDSKEKREVNTFVQIYDKSNIYVKKKLIPRVSVSDGSASAILFGFKNADFLRKTKPGVVYRLWGHFSLSERYGVLQSSDFEIEEYKNRLEDEKLEAVEAGREKPAIPKSKNNFGEILSVYRLFAGLRQWNLRTIIQNAINQYCAEIENEIPASIMEKHRLLPKKEALRAIHFPRSFAELKEARRSLIYEELFYLEIIIALQSLERRGLNAAAPTGSGEITLLQRRLLERLPFTLTPGQMGAVHEINRDMDANVMSRLLQGDVGSGKTLVSFLAALKTVEQGGQAVIMAPTELLAFQHAENAARLLEPIGVKVAFLTGNVKSSGRKNLLRAASCGDIDVVIGTHALFSRDVTYKNLRLVVIDEQHRFGVTQRQAILDKSAAGAPPPLLLMMSATPIPRTLAQTFFGGMDVSVIHGLPQGRKPIITRAFSQSNENKVYSLVRRELQKGRQAYFVYPLIGGVDEEPDVENCADEENSLKDAKTMAGRLANEIFPEYKTALIHSKIEDEEKKKIMESFRKNEINILAATSVVEVGVDAPNAVCMVIEHAERFGLSALHQLRGRVGRGEEQSTCFLVWTDDPAAPVAREADGEKLEIWQKRLKVMLETNDGFVIAEEDLKLRGPGQITGTEQSGYLTLGLADVIRDSAELEKAREDAFTLVKKDPHFKLEENMVVAEVLRRTRTFHGASF
ncbi:MAG: ATP-dependent DNA helicase RecG [Spirochaetaceae bacterium]|jgi:ATP-dependent DNA helicase RecG|nr:ATP-dependent DNA helicase RecG [Spirochaetaceae bacterium]